MASGSPVGSPRKKSPQGSPQQSPRLPIAAPPNPQAEEDRNPAPAPAPAPAAPAPAPAPAPVAAAAPAPAPAPTPVSAPAPAAREVNVAAAEELQGPPPERQLIKREVVRLDAAWLKRKNPNLNPRGFQVICTLSGGVDPAAAKKGSIVKPPPLVKDQREPPAKSIAVDVKEYADAYMFVADVPGLRNTDIKIDVVNDRFMTISCGRSRNDEPNTYYISRERTMGDFVRKFQLPGNSNLDAMKAGCQDGVLTILVPMSPLPAEHLPRPSFDVSWERRKSRG